MHMAEAFFHPYAIFSHWGVDMARIVHHLENMEGASELPPPTPSKDHHHVCSNHPA